MKRQKLYLLRLWAKSAPIPFFSQTALIIVRFFAYTYMYMCKPIYAERSIITNDKHFTDLKNSRRSIFSSLETSEGKVTRVYKHWLRVMSRQWIDGECILTTLETIDERYTLICIFLFYHHHWQRVTPTEWVLLGNRVIIGGLTLTIIANNHLPPSSHPHLELEVATTPSTILIQEHLFNTFEMTMVSSYKLFFDTVATSCVYQAWTFGFELGSKCSSL